MKLTLQMQSALMALYLAEDIEGAGYLWGDKKQITKNTMGLRCTDFHQRFTSCRQAAWKMSKLKSVGTHFVEPRTAQALHRRGLLDLGKLTPAGVHEAEALVAADTLERL